MDAVAVARAGPDAGQVDVPDVGRDLLDGDALSRRRRRRGRARRGRRARRRARSSSPARPRSRRAGRAARARPPGHRVTSAPASAGRTTCRRGLGVVGGDAHAARPRHRDGGPRPEVRDEPASPRPTPSQRRGLVELDLARVAVLQLAAHLEQPRVERAQRRVAARRVELRAPEGRRVLRVGHLLAANAAKAANSRRRPSRVAAAISSSMWSVKNWNGAVSPYSSPMKSIGVNGDSSVHEGGERSRLGGQAVAEGAVADLVVVLAKTTKAAAGGRRRARRSGGGGSSSTAVVDVGPPEGLGQVRDRAELGVVAVALAGEQHAQRVVEVVGPVGVAAPAAASARAR